MKELSRRAINGSLQLVKELEVVDQLMVHIAPLTLHKEHRVRQLWHNGKPVGRKEKHKTHEVLNQFVEG